MSATPGRLVVAGGGIAGLATALAVAARGHRVDVLERQDRFTELGAGIQLAPNAFAALDELGVGAQVRARSLPTDRLELIDGSSGRELVALDTGAAYRRRFGHPYAVVARGDLHSSLLEACRSRPGIRLRAATGVVGYRHAGDGVLVRTADGTEERADALVGADGLRSALRAQLVDDGPPDVVGHTIHRATVPMEEVPAEYRANVVRLWAGPGWHVVHYPIHGGRTLNLAATVDDGATTEVVGRPTPAPDVLARFVDVAAPVRALLEHGREWRTWVLCDRAPVRRWVDGRVVLLGDAAHPMLQYAAQGACQALEDAVWLGRALGGGPAGGGPAGSGLPARLVAFAEARHERTARAQRVARWMGEALFHPGGAEATARDARLAELSPDDVLDHVSDLHAPWTGPTPARATA